RRDRIGMGIPAPTIAVAPFISKRSSPLPTRITTPGKPPSFTSTFEPSPSAIHGSPRSSARSSAFAASSGSARATRYRAGPPIRYVVWRASGSFSSTRPRNLTLAGGGAAAAAGLAPPLTPFAAGGAAALDDATAGRLPTPARPVSDLAPAPLRPLATVFRPSFFRAILADSSRYPFGSAER